MSLIDNLNNKSTKNKEEEDEGSLHVLAKERYLNYAMSVIQGRALPDVRDGMKPVQRRILHAMYDDLKLTYKKKHRKSAAVVGEVMGKYHPHGDCLRGGTKVLMADGTISTMKSLYEDGQDRWVWSINEDGDPVCALAHSFRIGQKTDRIYRLKLSNGEELEVTSNHPIQNDKQKWVKAGDVEEGMFLYSAQARMKERPYLYMNFKPKQSKHLQEIGAENLKKSGAGYVLHHKDENPSNNAPCNLEFLTRAEHAKRHKDYLKGLEKGRSEMFSKKGRFRTKTKSKNSFLIKKWNENQGLYRAIKLVRELKKRGEAATKTNYSKLRDSGEFYNYPLISRMKKRGQIADFKDLVRLAKEQEGYIEFDPDEAYKNVPANKGVSSVSPSPNIDPLVENGQKKRVFDVFVECVKQDLNLNKASYEKMRQKLIDQYGQGERIHNRNYPKIGTIEANFGFDEVVREFKNKVPYVEKVEIISVDQEPMYDFTVDGHENMLVVVGSSKKDALTLASVHNSALYGAMVRMAQDFNTRVPLVDGHGNFGSVDGDNPAAMRYTEARLQEITSDLLEDLGNDSVDWQANYDSTTEEPTVLPVRAPIMLINGAIGIAVGFATNIPPHNPSEVIDATVDLVRKPNRRTSTLIKHHISGPDFPTGGIIVEGQDEMTELYKEGSGSITLRSRWTTEKERKHENIVITEIPYGIKKQDVVEDIAQHVLDGEIPQVVDIRDESTKDIRIVLELKQSADPEAVMAWMFKQTSLENSVHANMTCLVPEDEMMVPRQLGLKEILAHYIGFQLDVILRRSKYELEKVEDRIEILEGYELLFQDVEKGIEIVTGSKSKSAAKKELISEFKMNERQANAVLNSRIYRLIQQEKDEILEELKSRRQRADRLEEIITSKPERKDILIDQLKDIKKKYGEDRRTSIDVEVDDLKFDEANYIESRKMHVILSEGGWIRCQKSYGNIDTLRVRDNDQILWSLAGDTRECALFFTSEGRCYTIRIDDIPVTTGYGEPVQTLFNFANGEHVVNVMTTNKKVLGGGDHKDKEIVAVTSDGQATRFDLSGFLEPSTVRGRSFMRVDEYAEVVNIGLVKNPKKDRIVLATQKGQGITFPPSEVSFVKGAAKGVKAIQMGNNDRILGYELCGPSQKSNLMVTTSRGGTHKVTQNTYDDSKRGRTGYSIIKRGSLEEWNREPIEIPY